MIHITKPLSDDIQNIASYSPNHQAKVNKRFETKSKEKKKKFLKILNISFSMLLNKPCIHNQVYYVKKLDSK
jgi:hypothetical protein